MKTINNYIAERLHITNKTKSSHITFDEFKDFVFRLIKLYKCSNTWIALCDQYGDRFVEDELKDTEDLLWLCVDEKTYLNSDTNLNPIKDITLNGKYIEFNNKRFITLPYKDSNSPGGQYLTIDILPTLAISKEFPLSFYCDGHQYKLIDIIDCTDKELKEKLK